MLIYKYNNKGLKMKDHYFAGQLILEKSAVYESKQGIFGRYIGIDGEGYYVFETTGLRDLNHFYVEDAETLTKYIPAGEAEKEIH